MSKARVINLQYQPLGVENGAVQILIQEHTQHGRTWWSATLAYAKGRVAGIVLASDQPDADTAETRAREAITAFAKQLAG